MKSVIDEPIKNDDTASDGSVGALLRACRMRVGEDIGDVARLLCIRRPYLQAIEDGRFEDLPGTTYAAGFVRSYAEHLGLDAAEVVRRFKDETSGNQSASRLDFPVPVRESGVPNGALLFVGLLIAGLAYGVWYISTSTDNPMSDIVAGISDDIFGSGGSETDEISETTSEDGQEAQPQTDVEPSVSSVPETEVDQPSEAETPTSVVEEPEPVQSDGQAESDNPDVAEANNTDINDSQRDTAMESANMAEAPDADTQEAPSAEVTSGPVDTGEDAEPVSPSTTDDIMSEEQDIIETADSQEPGDSENRAPTSAVETDENTELPVASPSEAEATDVAEATETDVAQQESAAETTEVQVEPEILESEPAEATTTEAEPAEAEIAEAEPASPEAAEPDTNSETSAENIVPEPKAKPDPPTAAQSAPSDGTVYGQENANARIIVRAVANSYIQVRDEAAGEVLIARLLVKGDSYRVPDRTGLKLLAGNAGGIEILVDGEPTPPLGEVGALRRGVSLDIEQLKQGAALEP